MNRRFLLLFFLIMVNGIHAQLVYTGRYVPLNKSVKRKSLTLHENKTFHFLDVSTGSCFDWQSINGTWSVFRDTLYLLYEDKHVKSITERKFLICNYKISYIYTACKNIFFNWGELELEKNNPENKKLIGSSKEATKGISDKYLIARIKGKYTSKPPPTRSYNLIKISKTGFKVDIALLSQEVMMRWRKSDRRLVLEVWNYCLSARLYNLRYGSPFIFQYRQYPLEQMPGLDVIKTWYNPDKKSKMIFRRSKALLPSCYFDPQALCLKQDPDGMVTTWGIDFMEIKKPLSKYYSHF